MCQYNEAGDGSGDSLQVAFAKLTIFSINETVLQLIAELCSNSQAQGCEQQCSCWAALVMPRLAFKAAVQCCCAQALSMILYCCDAAEEGGCRQPEGQ